MSIQQTLVQPLKEAQMKPLALSVVISTFNRQEYLKAAIKSLEGQSYPTSDFEVIVVDNNSTDKTADLVAACSRSSPVRIKYLKEVRQGISYARNRGAREARGDVVAFLDDDAAAGSDWLERLAEVYATFPDAGAVGGRIEAVWPGAKPTWVTQNLELSLGGALNYGKEINELHYPSTPYGGNISIRRDLFLSVGGFAEDLGRSGRGLLGCEEVLLCYRMTQQGRKIYFSPHAVVHHRILPEKLTKRYIIKRAYFQGISVVALNRERGDGQSDAPAQLVGRLKNIIKDSIRHFLTGKQELWAEDLFYICMLCGRLKEALLPATKE
jgi:glycosyltransferase involved in cell wall biosynthesis